MALPSLSLLLLLVLSICPAHGVSTARQSQGSVRASPAALVRVKPVRPSDITTSDATDVILAKLKNVSRRRLDLYAQELNGAAGGGERMKKVGSLSSGDTTSFALHDKQRLYYTLVGCPDQLEGSFMLSASQTLYAVGKDLDSACPDLLQEYEEETEWSKSNEVKTRVPWRAYYGFLKPHLGPRGPPSAVSKMWNADREGQIHTLTTRQVHGGNPQQQSDLTLSLQVVSTSPRVFAIKNFLSLEEADHLIELGRDKLEDSVVGSETTGGLLRDKAQRSSSTAWLPPMEIPLVERIYRRAADVLTVQQDNVMYCTEQLQIVHYNVGQHYNAHFDFEITGKTPTSRFATLLLYLNDQASDDAGGETAFPAAKMDDGSVGFKIHPGKGSAVLFYNLLEDGNGDAASLHAALPVTSDEKWAANVWFWS